MHTTKIALLASTALTVAFVLSPAQAQDDQSCEGLLERVEELPEELPEDVGWTIEDVRAAEEEGDEEACAIILTDVERMSEEDGDEATASAEAEGDAEVEVESETQAEAGDSEDMEAVQREQTRVTLEDEAVIEGTVFIDRERASVDISEGETEVMVTPGQPNVSVNEEAAQITVREQPARISVEMAQPTIRIEQPAPEIIITMPEPGVDVSSADPQVEVRQAEPEVTVTQRAPSVDLELQVAENPDESGGVEVEDRDSGERFAMGETQDMPVEDADVSVTRSEPVVRMQSPDNGSPQIDFSRAEPTINYERAEPEVNFSQTGEPSVEFARSGEPSVTIRRNGEDDGEGDEASADGQGEQGSDDGEGSETADAENGRERNGEEMETAAEETGEDIETAAEETGEDIETAAEETGREVEEETDEMASDMEGGPEDDTVRLTEGEVGTEEDDQQTDMAQGGDAAGNDGMADRDGMSRIELADLTMDDLDGTALYGADGDRIGEVSEAVLAEDGLRVTGAVVEVGGFLGLGVHHVMLELDQIEFYRNDMGNDVEAYVSMSQDELEAMPEWEEQ